MQVRLLPILAAQKPQGADPVSIIQHSEPREEDVGRPVLSGSAGVSRLLEVGARPAPSAVLDATRNAAPGFTG
jgi:hypothetical protein